VKASLGNAEEKGRDEGEAKTLGRDSRAEKRIEMGGSMKVNTIKILVVAG